MVLILALAVGLDGLEKNLWTRLSLPTENTKDSNFSDLPEAIPLTRCYLEDATLLTDKDRVRNFDSALPIRSSIESIWEVLTDYENIEKFQPGIVASGLLESLPNGDKQLEQTMVQRFLIFKKRLHLVVRIVEKPPHRIQFSILRGDFNSYDGAWQIDTTTTEPELRLVIAVEPNISAPGSVLDHIVRSSSEKSLLSVIEEAERREK